MLCCRTCLKVRPTRQVFKTRNELFLGAAMAIEDGVGLSRALSKMTSPDQLPECLEIFQRVRCSRANQMQEASLLNGHLWHFPDGPLQQARDAAMAPEVKGIPFVSSPNQWSDPATQMWCYGYDTEMKIDESWEESRAKEKSGLY